MERVRILHIIIWGLIFSSTALAQGPRGGFNPSEMVAREKQNLYKELTDLTEDQKILLDVIYDEYTVSIDELREEVRASGDYQSMRPKFQALRSEKDGLIKDVLNEEQYAVYENQMKLRQERRRPSQPRPVENDSIN